MKKTFFWETYLKLGIDNSKLIIIHSQLKQLCIPHRVSAKASDLAILIITLTNQWRFYKVYLHGHFMTTDSFEVLEA